MNVLRWCKAGWGAGILCLLLGLSGCAEPARYQYAEQMYRSGNYSQAFGIYRQYLLDYPEGAHAAEVRSRLGTLSTYLDIEDKATRANEARGTGDFKTAFSFYRVILPAAINSNYPKVGELRPKMEETRKRYFEHALAVGEEASAKKDWETALSSYKEAESVATSEQAQTISAKIKRVSDAIDLLKELKSDKVKKSGVSPTLPEHHSAPARRVFRSRSGPEIIGPNRLPSRQHESRAYQGNLGSGSDEDEDSAQDDSSSQSQTSGQKPSSKGQGKGGQGRKSVPWSS